MAQPYRPTLRPSARALAAMFLTASSLVLLLAATWHWLGSLGEIVVFGMMARGLIIGIILSFVCGRTGFAHARAAAGLAIATTLISAAGTQYLAYREHRADAIADAQELRFQSEGYGRNPTALEAEYESTVAALSFKSYLGSYYGIGGSVQSMKRDRASSMLGPSLGIGLCAVEVVLALLASAYYPAGRASEPACPTCGRWHQERPLPPIAHGQSSSIALAFLDEKTDRVSELFSQPDTKEWTELVISSCPIHHHGSHVLRIRDHYFPSTSRVLKTRHIADLVLLDSEYNLVQHWSDA